MVAALDRLGGRTLSVLICLWNLVLVAASESPGMSSLTCTVCACCRKLSRRENRLEQWHWNGRSPVCFLMCLARCSLRVKLRLQGGNSVQKNLWPFFFLDGLCESLVTLSLSDPSSSAAFSSSPSAMSTSCSSVILPALCMLSRFRDPSGSCDLGCGCSGVTGSSGKARWPGTPPKSCEDGVAGSV